MELCKETKWLCENAKRLEKFAGQWVSFSANEGLVGSGSSLDHALKNSRNKHFRTAPFVFHVPSKEELTAPLPFAPKK